jgi:hypothetical protein
LVTPVRFFDFTSLNFQLLMCGFAAKQPAAIVNDRATVTVAIRVAFMPGFGHKPRTTSSVAG